MTLSDDTKARIASLVPAHMVDGLVMYVEHGIPPGSFLLAVLENNLAGAAALTDEINKLCLFQWTDVLWNELPGDCWGSPEKVRAWIAARAAERERGEAP